MSFIGQNIRKIRSVKNLNQSEFAEMFDLKRASIGAYEEGRAEPKVGTILDIANHFGIAVDDLLKKELSVNDLYRFDIFREDLMRDATHNLTPSVVPVDVIGVPFVSVATKDAYLKDRKDQSALETLNLPLPKGAHYRAFELEDDAMSVLGQGAGAGDIAIGCRPEKFSNEQLEQGRLYIFETADNYYFRKLGQKSLSAYRLLALNADFYSSDIPSKTVTDVWQVCQIITKNIGNQDEVVTRLAELEKQMREMRKGMER